MLGTHKPALGNPLPARSRSRRVARSLNLNRRGAPGSGCQASPLAGKFLRSLTAACHTPMKTTVLLILLVISTIVAMASEEEFLEWTSVVVQCGKTQEAGDVSCDIKIEGDGWKKFVIQAFGKTHALTASELKKLREFPLSSLRTSHEAGYERLGGHTVHFRFSRKFYNADGKLITEIIYVSATKEGATVSAPRTMEHHGEQVVPPNKP
jgi:hypothetical protein